MIDIDRTLSVLGVDVSTLTPGSHTKVFRVCEGCERYKLLKYHNAIKHPFCRSCVNKGRKHSAEAIKKMSEIASNISDEHRKKISESAKCRTYSEETKKKMSEARKGEKNHNYGKKLSEETRKKISESAKCRTCSEETKKKMSVTRQGISYEEWDGFVSFGKYCPKFNEAFKESIREKFGRVCFLCPITEEENGRKLSVHHVNYDKSCLCDDMKCEFVPLCMKCHATTNCDREHWESFIDTRQKTPLLVAGMNAAEWLDLVMFYPLNILLNNFAAHFPRGPDIVTP